MPSTSQRIGCLRSSSSPLDFMPFKLSSHFVGLFLAALQPEIVQATCNHHRQIRETLLGVPEFVLHAPTSLHSGQRMLHTNAKSGQLSVLLFLLWGQCPFPWLFWAGTSAARAARSPESCCPCPAWTDGENGCSRPRPPSCRASCPRRCRSGN